MGGSHSTLRESHLQNPSSEKSHPGHAKAKVAKATKGELVHQAHRLLKNQMGESSVYRESSHGLSLLWKLFGIQ